MHTRIRASEKDGAFAFVFRERRGAFEFGACLAQSSESLEHVGARCGKVIVARERPIGCERIDHDETCERTFPHRDRDGAIERDDG